MTGAGRGIGKAMAARLAADGASVTIADIAGYDVAAAELAKAGARTLGLKVDVSSESDTASMAEETLRAFGRIDILVNCAAMFATVKLGPFEEIPASEWKRSFHAVVGGQDRARDPVRAAVVAGDRPAGAYAGDADSSGAGGRRIWRQ